MSETARQPVLLTLAAEAIVPALPGCAEVLRGGVTTKGLIERGLSLFGPLIAACWHQWSRSQPTDSRRDALNELAALSQEDARRGAADAFACLAPDARPQDRAAASAYLAAIPRTLDQIWRDHDPTSPWSPGTVSWEQPNDLMRALPHDAPPYNAPCDLPGTPYRLEQLLGAGGFGAVYRAAASSLQHLPFAVKFCLDPTLAPALHLERSNLERLMQAGRDPAAQRIVRLYGYDFTHATPYLVYEYVSGGDLDRHVRGRRRLQGRRLSPPEVFGIIQQVAQGLAFAHRHGLVHRDLKPANILFDGKLFKLADFGIGGAAVVRAVRADAAGSFDRDIEGEASPLTRFRAAGTPLYMSPEQCNGAPPDQRHDLYSLGVMWHQLLADDFTRQLQFGWAKDLAVRFEAPRNHLKLIERCVGRFEDRPKDAGELCDLLSGLVEEARILPPPIPPESSMEAIPLRRSAPPLTPREGPLLDRLTGVMRYRRGDSDGPLRTPAPHVEVPAARRTECAELLRGLSHAHADTAPRSAWPGTSWPALTAGALAGGLTYEVYYVIKYPQYGLFSLLGGGPFDGGAIVSGFAAIVAVYALVLLAQHQLRLWRQRQARSAVDDAVRRLVDRFPDVVRSWGGAPVLYDADQVARLLRAIETEPRS
jgi:serine/threonine protein kinase